MNYKRIVNKIVNLPLNLIATNLIILILIAAFFVRVYRINDLLGFYYDQGRDALAIWNFIHLGKPFLIGPVTGLSGIFLGPFYYYLITPLYFIGRGNPVYPAVFLGFLSTLAILILYLLGKSMHGRTAGLIAAIIGAFSYYIVTTSRWLSNPNPILLSSTILLFSLWKIIDSKRSLASYAGKSKWWMIAALMVGLSLQFESASAVFYLPIVLIFIIWQRKKLPGLKTILISGMVFLATFLPQIIFNFRHENILLNNFAKLFLEEKAFRGLTKFILEERLKFFWSVFSTKLYAGREIYASIFTALAISALFVKRKLLKKGLLTLFIIFLITPMVFYTFFQGNFGNIYDYYLSGYYLPLILLFSIGLAEFSKTVLGKITVIIFIITFLQFNGNLVRGMLTNPMDGPTDIKLGSQIKAVNWVLDDAKAVGNYNLDIYVPPVIPHAYDYLFLWQNTVQHAKSLPVTEEKPTVYLFYEQDPPHPERLINWMDKENKAAEVVESAKFGGITVERRTRL